MFSTRQSKTWFPRRVAETYHSSREGFRLAVVSIQARFIFLLSRSNRRTSYNESLTHTLRMCRSTPSILHASNWSSLPSTHRRCLAKWLQAASTLANNHLNQSDGEPKATTTILLVTCYLFLVSQKALYTYLDYPSIFHPCDIRQELKQLDRKDRDSSYR